MTKAPVAAAAAVLALAGCAALNVLDTEVTSFSRWPADRAPATYVFERLPSQQANPQAAAVLEDSARRAVEAAGFVPAAEGAVPDVSVQIGARITATDRSPYDDPFWYGPYGWGPYYRPFYGRYGRGYWGPYWGYCYGWGYNAAGGITAWGPYGWAGTSGNIYSQNGPWSGVSRYQGGFNAWTGNRWASQYGRAYNSTTGTRAIGARGAVANVYTGGYAYGARGAAVNENTGNAAWGSKVTGGNVGTGNEVTARRGGVYNNETGDVTRYGSIHGENGGVARVGDDVYAGHDGNVYKRGDDGSWSEVSRPQPKDNALGAGGSGTRDLNHASSYGSGFDSSSLDQAYNSRQMGAARAQSYHTSRPAFHGGGMRRR